MVTFVNTLHIVICLALIGIVLLQQGKGADTGAVFGGGSNTLFGASGADTLLTKITTGLAVGFFATSIFLALNARYPAVAAPEKSLLGESAPVSHETSSSLPTAALPQEVPSSTEKSQPAPQGGESPQSSAN